MAPGGTKWECHSRRAWHFAQQCTEQYGVVSFPSVQKSSRIAPILQGAKPSVCIRKDVAMTTELLWKHEGVHVASKCNRDNTCEARAGR